jgi:hypothetical protein
LQRGIFYRIFVKLIKMTPILAEKNALSSVFRETAGNFSPENQVF